MYEKQCFPLFVAASWLLLGSHAGCGGTDPVAPGGAVPSSTAAAGTTGAGAGASDGGGSASSGAAVGAGGAATGGGGAFAPDSCPAATHPVVGIDGATIPGVRECKSLSYDPAVDLADVTLDLYVPPGYAPGIKRPAIVYLHGGGWKAGNKSEVKGHQLEYLKRGWFVLSLDYRLSDFGPTENPVDMTSGAPPSNATTIQDVKTALQFIHGHYGDFIDTEALVVWGFSAGAHLGMLSAVSSNDEADHPELRGRSPGGEPSRVAAVVAQSPAVDFGLYIADPLPTCGSLSADPSLCGTPAKPIAGKCVTDPQCTGASCQFGDQYTPFALAAVEAMLGAPITDPPTGVTFSVTPIGFVDPDDPPIYALSGTCDCTIPPQGAKAFGPAAKAKGADVTVKLVEGAGHRETMDEGPNPSADADVLAWLVDRGLPAAVAR